MSERGVSKAVEIVGLVAIILSLGLVAWELKQANSLARATVHAEINQQLNDLNLETAANGEFAEILSVLADADREHSAIERERALGLAFFLRNSWINAERAYMEGWISENKFQAQLNDIDWTVKIWPGLRPYMREITEFQTKNREMTIVEARMLEVTR